MSAKGEKGLLNVLFLTFFIHLMFAFMCFCDIFATIIINKLNLV